MTKLFKYIKKDIKTYWKNYLVFILIVPWFFIPFDCNIYSPGSLVDLTDRIEVNSNYESKGSFNLTYVTSRKGTLPNIILSKFFKVVTTIFFIPGILPIVPGVAMYKTVYAMINNNTSDIIYYLLQSILIAGGIALAIFITDSIRDLKLIKRRKEKNENKI